jgi:hypothetical protein
MCAVFAAAVVVLWLMVPNEYDLSKVCVAALLCQWRGACAQVAERARHACLDAPPPRCWARNPCSASAHHIATHTHNATHQVLPAVTAFTDTARAGVLPPATAAAYPFLERTPAAADPIAGGFFMASGVCARVCGCVYGRRACMRMCQEWCRDGRVAPCATKRATHTATPQPRPHNHNHTHTHRLRQVLVPPCHLDDAAGLEPRGVFSGV